MKIAMIIQRFGENVNGGAESYVRDLALRLRKTHDIEIITTTAEDYTTWDPYFNEGIDIYKDLIIRRFNPDNSRDNIKFEEITNKILRYINQSKEQEYEWIRKQGPFSSEMFLYLKQNHYKYDVFIFCTYLYAQSFFGPRFVPKRKTVLIPMAHDEKWIRLSVFKESFEYIDKIIYLTQEEKKFVEGFFNNVTSKNIIAGSGINFPDIINEEVYKSRNNLDKYIAYAGRIDPAKGCDKLIKYFLKYLEDTESKIDLVLLGKSYMKIPKNKKIKPLGYVSEEEKFSLIKGALAFVLPSRHESLSISTLESLSMGTPVIVNAKSEVLKGHCIRSNAGLFYEDYYEFHECLNFILNNKSEVEQMQMNAVKYINSNYRWDKCISNINTLLDS